MEGDQFPLANTWARDMLLVLSPEAPADLTRYVLVKREVPCLGLITDYLLSDRVICSLTLYLKKFPI